MSFNQTISNAVANLKDAGNPFIMLVMGATNDDGNSSVSYYKLDEIKDASFQSRNGCELIHKSISQRLEAHNPIIVYKTLQVCRTLLLEGPEEFKKMMYQTTGRIQNIANLRKNNPDTFYARDSVEADNMALAEKVYQAVVGDVMVLASHDQVDRVVKPREHSSSVGTAATMGYRSDFQMHQEKERKAFMKRMQEEKARGATIVGHAQFETFDSTLSPAKLVDSALNNAKKKFSPEELNNFVESTFETGKIKEVCSALDKVLKDGKSTLVIRYKAIAFVEALVTEINEALEFFKVHNLGIHRHLSIEHGDNPTKSALTQKIAQRAMDIVHGKIEVPAATPPPVEAPVAPEPAQEESPSSPSYFTPPPKVQPPGGRRQMTEQTVAPVVTASSGGWGGGGDWGDANSGWGAPASSSWGDQPSSPIEVPTPNPTPAPTPDQQQVVPPTPQGPNPQDMLMQMQQQMMLLQKQMMATTTAAAATPDNNTTPSPEGEEHPEEEASPEQEAAVEEDEPVEADHDDDNEHPNEANDDDDDDAQPQPGSDAEVVEDEEEQQRPMGEEFETRDNDEEKAASEEGRARSASVDDATTAADRHDVVADPLVSSSTMMEVPNNSMIIPGSPSFRNNDSMCGSAPAVPNNSIACFGNTPNANDDDTAAQSEEPMSPQEPPASPAPLTIHSPAAAPIQSETAPVVEASVSRASSSQAQDTQDQMMRQMQEFHRNMQMMMGMMMQQTIQRSTTDAAAAPTPATNSTTFVDPNASVIAQREAMAKQEAEMAQRKAQEAEEKARRKERLTQDLKELLGQMRATQGMLDEQKQQLSFLKLKLQEL